MTWFRVRGIIIYWTLRWLLGVNCDCYCYSQSLGLNGLFREKDHELNKPSLKTSLTISPHSGWPLCWLRVPLRSKLLGYSFVSVLEILKAVKWWPFIKNIGNDQFELCFTLDRRWTPVCTAAPPRSSSPEGRDPRPNYPPMLGCHH